MVKEAVGADNMNIWLQVTSGRGPAECCYVVRRVVAVIRQEVENRGMDFAVLETVAGSHRNTLLSALISIEGEHAEEFARSWGGTIQWVGQSPFRPRHKRKNWFVGVSVLSPFVGPLWQAKEFKVQTLRSSGPGGQHINKTESAVRVTHEPSGVTACAQEERSQHRNRQLAIARVLAQLEARQRAAKKDHEQEMWTHHNRLERGNAIRIFEGPDFVERNTK